MCDTCGCCGEVNCEECADYEDCYGEDYTDWDDDCGDDPYCDGCPWLSAPCRPQNPKNRRDR